MLALTLGIVPGCGSKAESECSTLDKAGNPIPTALGSARRGKGKAIPAAPECQKTKDCPKSCICRDLGRCKTSEDGTCVVAEEQHCRQSKICRIKGFCTLSGSVCVAGTDEDCANSESCKRIKYCKAYGGICVKEIPK